MLGVHTPDYVHALKTGTVDPKMMRRIGFPLTPELIEREWIITQGTIDATRIAQKDGVAMNVAGGTHHAFPDRGEGFCLLNDVGVAAHYLLETGRRRKFWSLIWMFTREMVRRLCFSRNRGCLPLVCTGRITIRSKKNTLSLDIDLPTGTTDEAVSEYAV